MTEKIIKALIVDDHNLIRLAFKALLSKTDDIVVIGDVATGEEAIEMTALHHPDVILMDLRMPGMGGRKATQAIAKDYPESRILIVSSCSAEPSPASLLAAGATGFLSKKSDGDEMLYAVRQVASGIRYLSPDIEEIDLDKQKKSLFSILSNEELKVALLLIRGEKGKNIAKKMNINPKVVSAYRSRIYDKLNVRTDVALTLLATRHGIVKDSSIPEKRMLEN